MYNRTEAVVLTSQRFSEADLLVTYLTRDFGIVTLFAKSPRKVGSRFGSSLEPLTHSKIAFLGKEQSNLPRLIQSDIIHPFHSIRQDYLLMQRLALCIRLTIRVIPQRTPVPELFSILLAVEEFLEEDPSFQISITYYLARLLQVAGFAPGLDRCALCGNDADRFYLTEGSIICSGCIEETQAQGCIEVTEGVRRLYRFLIEIPPQVLKRVKVSEGLRHRLEELLLSHINYTVEPGDLSPEPHKWGSLEVGR